MPTFKFRLESVLQLRKRIEDERKKELAILKDLLHKEQDFVKELDARIHVAQGRIKNEEKDGTSLHMDEIMSYYQYLAACKERKGQQVALIADLEGRIDRKREELIGAAKDRKMIEKLRENKLKEFNEHMEKWETNMLDELATDGYTHRKEQHAANSSHA